MSQQSVQITPNLYVTAGCKNELNEGRHLWEVKYRSKGETYSTVQCLGCGEVAYLDG